MKLYIITDYQDREKNPKNLVKEAEKQKIEYEIIRAPITNFLDLPQLNKSDAVFRIGVSERSKLIERSLFSEAKGEVSSFYKNLDIVLNERKSSHFANMVTGLPIIKTIPIMPIGITELIETVDYLGGFPLVVKVVGGSKGVGVLRADSIESLKSIIDYLRTGNISAQLRQYIPHSHYARLVVVGDDVVGSHCTYVMENEFRSNAAGNSENNKKTYIPSDEMISDAVKAVHSTGVVFGGVDFLITETGVYFIAEVNFPCGFGSTERIAKINISSQIISYLKSKSDSILSN